MRHRKEQSLPEVPNVEREDPDDSRWQRTHWRKTLALMLVAYTGIARSAYAQGPVDPEIVIGPNPVGSGARALGQSAFIAVADDATAASWNPAGLINLEKPEISFVGASKTTTYDYSAGDNISVGPDSWSQTEVNFMSYAQPIEFGNTDVVLSVNYHQVYDFGFELDYSVLEGTDTISIRGKSEGVVAAYSVAGGLAAPFCPQLTVGASLNWYSQGLLNDYAWRETKSNWLNSRWGLTERETFDNFRGYNFSFGFLWDVYEKQENLLTLGAVCHTPYVAEVDREVIEFRPGWAPLCDTNDVEIDFPLSVGVGANYRLSDAASIAFDIEWKDWSEFKQRTLDNGQSTSPIGGGHGHVADTWAVRLGFECLTFSPGGREWVRALRGGVFYEPRPALNDPMPVYGLSLGIGWTLKERFSLDFAYQFRWGEEVGAENLGQGLQDIDYDVQEHFVIGSVITYF